MDSYLTNTFLGDLADDMGDDIGADGATMALTPATGERTVAAPEYVTLPGGIYIEKKTFYLVIAAIAAVALYLYMKKKPRRDD